MPIRFAGTSDFKSIARESLLKTARAETGLPIAAELTDSALLPLFADVDLFLVVRDSHAADDVLAELV